MTPETESRLLTLLDRLEAALNDVRETLRTGPEERSFSPGAQASPQSSPAGAPPHAKTVEAFADETFKSRDA